MEDAETDDKEATERDDTDATDAIETNDPVDMVASTELGRAVSEIVGSSGTHAYQRFWDKILTETGKSRLAGFAVVHSRRRWENDEVEGE